MTKSFLQRRMSAFGGHRAGAPECPLLTQSGHRLGANLIGHSGTNIEL